MNLVQDTAWIHATHLGHGYENMLRDRTAWVLTRQKLAMKIWPRWGEEIELKTWIRPITSMVAIRDFQFLTGDEIVGECTTQWLILDLNTRRPSEKSLQMDPSEFAADTPVIFDAAKIPLKRDLKEVAQFNVRNSDLDLNGHVNNTRYAQWILDAISEEKHREYVLQEYEVNFIAETKLGDLITICSASLQEDKFLYQGIRASDQKTVFAATLKVSAQQLSPSFNQS